MKYDKLKICGLPKSFNLWASIDYVDTLPEEHDVDDIQYDMLPLECDEEKGEIGMVVFRYNESATGVYIVYNKVTNVLELELLPWASEADVKLYALYINAVLTKHKRARLYERFAPLPAISDEAVQKMLADRQKYLSRLLAKGEEFELEGLNACYVVNPTHLRPAPSVDMQVQALRDAFVKAQW